MRQDLIHVYTGNGKGKTTAALGLLLRASGRGMRTVLVQLLKGRDTGELYAIENLCGITVLRSTRKIGFYAFASEQGKTEITCQNNAILTEAYHLVSEGLYDLMVMDEICAAYNNGALDKALADQLILNKPCGLELVLTGCDAPLL